MSNIREFTCIQISDETTNGNKILKLQRKLEAVSVGFGSTKSKSETYYMAVGSDTTATVGQKDNLDLDLFEVTERPFEHPTEGEIMLKWLHLK